LIIKTLRITSLGISVTLFILWLTKFRDETKYALYWINLMACISAAVHQLNINGSWCLYFISDWYRNRLYAGINLEVTYLRQSLV